MLHFNKSSRKLIEEDSDPTLLIFGRGIIEIPFNDQVLLNDARYMHYSRNRKCIILKDELPYRQRSYNEVDEVDDISVTTKTNFYHTFQVLARYSKQACEHLPDDAGNIMRKLLPINLQIRTKMGTTLRYYFQCKRINSRQIGFALLNVPKLEMGPGDVMQTDLFPETPTSGGYEIKITAVDVFSRYAFANPVPRRTAANIAKTRKDITTTQAYLTTLLITDQTKDQFFSPVVIEVAAVLGITLKHATTKHAQTIVVPERTHGTIKTPVRMASGEYQKQ